MFRVIKGQKIKEQRGKRSLREIAAVSNNAFTDVALLEWENGSYKPKDSKIPALLRALNCTYEDISEEVEVTLP
jgi:transcriptional regulator with XRE-family HTH domain